MKSRGIRPAPELVRELNQLLELWIPRKATPQRVSRAGPQVR